MGCCSPSVPRESAECNLYDSKPKKGLICENEDVKFETNESENAKHDYRTITILFLGSSGHGKTTLINMLNRGVNRISYQCNEIALKPENTDNNGGNAVERKIYSSKFKNYKINDEENSIIYNVFESPGIDIGGNIEENNLNIIDIFQFLISIHQLHAIVLTINSKAKSLGRNLQFLIKRVVQLIPKDYIVNIMIALTFFDMSTPTAKSIINNLLTTSIGDQPINFKFYSFNNMLSFDRANKNDSLIAKPYKESMDTINELCIFVQKLKPLDQSLMFCELNDSIADAKSLITRTQNKYISSIEEKEVLEESLKKIIGGDTECSAFKEFTYAVTAYELEDCPKHNTVCTGCFVIRNTSMCHENCGLQYTVNTDANIFKSCGCMGSSGLCNVCGCGPETHQHIKKRPIGKIVIKTLDHQVMKSRYLNADVISKRKIIQEEINKKISDILNDLNFTKVELGIIIQKIRTKYADYNIKEQLECNLRSLDLQIKAENDLIKSKKLSAATELIKSAISSLS